MQRILSFFLALFLLFIPRVHAEKYRITRLNTPTIKVGGVAKAVGDIIDDVKTIGWADNNQSVEVKNLATGSTHRFSKKTFESHGGVVSIRDYFISIKEASTRDFDNSKQYIFTKSPLRTEFPERRIALVIGNSNYENLSYLRNAQKDASDVASALLDLGFDVMECYECTSSQLHTAINRFSSAAKDGYDMALFYFAGHGLQEEGKNYLLPVESKLEDIRELRDFLYCDNVVKHMESTNTRSRLIVLDACRNAKKSWTRDVDEGLARMEGGVGSVILFSTQSGKRAFDGNGENSPFAKAFLENIVKPGVEFPLIMNGVVKDTYQLTDNKQSPLRTGDFVEDFIFNPSAATVATAPATIAKENEVRVSVASSAPASSMSVRPLKSEAMTPTVKMSSDDIEVKIESCNLTNGNAYVDLRFINRTQKDMVLAVSPKEDIETSADDSYGQHYAFSNISFQSGGDAANGTRFVAPYGGLPVKVRIKIANVDENLNGFSNINVALRGADSQRNNGVASLSISDVPVGYSNPAAAENTDGEMNIDFGVEGVTAKVSNARRSGNKLSFELTLSNNTLHKINTGILNHASIDENIMTRVYDSNGTPINYGNGLAIYLGNNLLTNKGFTLLPYLSRKLRIEITDYKGTGDTVIPIFTASFRKMDKKPSGPSQIRITNIPIE